MELYNYDVHKNNQLERLKTSTVTSFILFCDMVFFVPQNGKHMIRIKKWNVLYDSGD